MLVNLTWTQRTLKVTVNARISPFVSTRVPVSHKYLKVNTMSLLKSLAERKSHARFRP